MSGAIAGHVEQIFIDNMKDIEITPDEYAPALFWAGRYESLTDLDEKDYILNCFIPNEELTKKLSAAQEAYIQEDRQTGYEKMAETRSLFKSSMLRCPKVWKLM